MSEYKQLIVHISEVNISLAGGMGRIEYHWEKSFKESGFDFIHIGPAEVGPLRHKGLFPYMAYRYLKKLSIQPKALIVHEPASGAFVRSKIPCFVESHGIERKIWEDSLNRKELETLPSFKTRLTYPIWRLYNCDKGLKYAKRLLLTNTDDKKYACKQYGRKEDDIYVFKNGVNSCPLISERPNEFTVLFNASWLNRKGIRTLIQSAQILFSKGLAIKYLLIGTGLTEDTVLQDWPENLRKHVTVVPKFDPKDEIKYLFKSSIFVLPSYFEGQPLSLLQAMAAGKCCLTTNCCGQKDIITDGINGLLFEKGDAPKLGELILKCFNNSQLSETIGQKAREYVAQLPWETVAKDVVNYVISNIDTK